MVYMYHSSLIHSSADGHLGCFHVLAIINSFKKKYRQVCTDEPKAFYTNQIFFSTPFSMMITNEISEVMIFCVTEIFSYQAQIDKLFFRKYGDNF